MNTKTWGIFLISLCAFNLVMGTWNITEFAVDNTDYLSLGVGIFAFAVGVYMMNTITKSWYPTYKMEQQYKSRT